MVCVHNLGYPSMSDGRCWRCETPDKGTRATVHKTCISPRSRRRVVSGHVQIFEANIELLIKEATARSRIMKGASLAGSRGYSTRRYYSVNIYELGVWTMLRRGGHN